MGKTINQAVFDTPLIALDQVSRIYSKLMRVLEQTHEIGILSAVGWPTGHIIKMIVPSYVCFGRHKIRSAAPLAGRHSLRY
jgi:hypothetical protein